jgi:DNA-binding Xre family transcriptional regulator
MNDKLKEAIEYAMFKHRISKVELADLMNISYPTMLSRLKSPELMKFSEADKLCDILNMELRVEFLNLKK